MRTIYTTLPIYDRLAKQCFQRATNKNGRNKLAGNDKIIPIVCPRHRLPSFEVYMDAEDIKDIDFINSAGVNIDEMDIISLANSTYDTFTITGDSAACVNAAGTAAGFLSSYFDAKVYTWYKVVLNLTYTSGEYPHISLRDSAGNNNSSYPILHNGLNTVYLYTNSVANIDPQHLVVWNTAAANFSIEIISFKFGTFNYFANSNDLFINSVYTAMGGYDSATESYAERSLILEKTTTVHAAGYKFYSTLTGWAGIAEGDKVYVHCYLDMTSGTAPKMAIMTNAVATPISNVVQLVDGENYFVLTATSASATGRVIMYNEQSDLANFSIVFYIVSQTSWPAYYDSNYLIYNSAPLSIPLPEGTYYLRLTTESDYVYFSEWFLATCVYENLITGWTNGGVGNTYETFTVSGTEIEDAVNSAGTAQAYSDEFAVSMGEEITVIFNALVTSGAVPSLSLRGSVTGSPETVSSGLNVITLTAEEEGDVRLYISNAAATTFVTSEVIVIRGYSEKYLIINFSNSCDIGDLLYHSGMIQTVWFESETMEPSFPTEEEGQKNGEGKFVRTFGRQVRELTARTGEMPDYMVDVFNRMRLHDTVQLIDLVGDVHSVYNLKVDHEWLYEDKYYAKIDLVFDYDEVALVMSCCVNIP